MIRLLIPELDDYYYEEKIQSDPKTMSYNAGWDVSYDEYHYDTGCIDFPKEKWKETYEKRKKEDIHFYYILDEELNTYVGYCNYHYNKNENRYDIGILIEDKYKGKGYGKKGLILLCKEAFKNGVDEVFDNFEYSRKEAMNLFKKIGFKEVREETYLKFKKEEKGALLCLNEKEFIKYLEKE